MSKIYHIILAYLFYCAGDVICRLPWEWNYRLYQFLMKQSVEHDDLSGNRLWKITEQNYEDSK